jgi:hypothetical protein
MNDQLYMITLYYNPKNNKELYNRHQLFQQLIEAKGIKLTTVECFNSEPSSYPISNSQKYNFTVFNYYEAILKGIKSLPSNWEKVLLCDMNIEFADADFNKKIETAFESNGIIQLFERSVTINPSVEKVIDTNYSLTYSHANEIPTSKKYFAMWFADPGCAWGMRREVYESIKINLEDLKGFYMSPYMLSYSAVKNVESLLDKDLYSKLSIYSVGFAENLVYKYVKSEVCQYERFLQEIEYTKNQDIRFLDNNCGIYPELRKHVLDYIFEFEETLQNGKLLKNIWGNITNMTVDNEITFVQMNNTKGAIKNEKVMNINLILGGDSSTICGDDEDYVFDTLSQPDTEINYQIDDEKLVAKYGAAFSCNCIAKAKGGGVGGEAGGKGIFAGTEGEEAGENGEKGEDGEKPKGGAYNKFIPGFAKGHIEKGIKMAQEKAQKMVDAKIDEMKPKIQEEIKVQLKTKVPPGKLDEKKEKKILALSVKLTDEIAEEIKKNFKIDSLDDPDLIPRLNKLKDKLVKDAVDGAKGIGKDDDAEAENKDEEGGETVVESHVEKTTVTTTKVETNSKVEVKSGVSIQNNFVNEDSSKKVGGGFDFLKGKLEAGENEKDDKKDEGLMGKAKGMISGFANKKEGEGEKKEGGDDMMAKAKGMLSGFMNKKEGEGEGEKKEGGDDMMAKAKGMLSGFMNKKEGEADSNEKKEGGDEGFMGKAKGMIGGFMNKKEGEGEKKEGGDEGFMGKAKGMIGGFMNKKEGEGEKKEGGDDGLMGKAKGMIGGFMNKKEGEGESKDKQGGGDDYLAKAKELAGGFMKKKEGEGESKPQAGGDDDYMAKAQSLIGGFTKKESTSEKKEGEDDYLAKAKGLLSGFSKSETKTEKKEEVSNIKAVGYNNNFFSESHTESNILF